MAVTPEQQPAQPQKPEGKKELGALFKAVKAYREAKDKSSMDRIEIFITTLLQEVGLIDKEEAEVSAETQKTVQKGVDETVKGAQDAAGLDKTKVADKADQDFWDENVARAVKSHKSLPQTQQGHALEGMKKLEKAVNGGTAEPLGDAEAAALGASTVMTLQELKKTFPNKDDFQRALVRLKDLSAHSKFPLEKVMLADGLLKMSDGDKLSLLNSFGIKGDELALGLAGGSLGKLQEHITAIKEGTISDDAVAFFKEHFLPNTNAVNVQEALNVLQGVIAGNANMSPETLTNLVFLIDDADYSNLVKILTSKNDQTGTV